ncbi:MAG: hypothetical protein NTW82_06400 [Bacteroidia bacterium]|nr:hypothetical protein [Bacteroidia bacterium]
MKPSEIKKLIIGSTDGETDTGSIASILEGEGVSFDFKNGFTEKVTDRIFAGTLSLKREVDFTRSLSFVFYRIAITGIAAIVILMISIFVMQDSFSFNSFLGLGDGYAESIVYLITGN